MEQAEQPIQRGREAIERHAWREAYDLLSPAAAADTLPPEDLENYAEAAWWIGRLDECIEARERVYAAEMAKGNRRAAALAAVMLENDHRLAPAVAAGWLGRAERLLQEEPECAELGWLLRAHTNHALHRGDLDVALEHAGRMLEVGDRLGDRDLQALAIHERGRALVAKGEVETGMALLDEAAVAAVSGELEPLPTAIIYCNVIAACRDLADYRRAGDWTEAAKRWCERQAISGFPGICSVFRAEIMRLRGAWDDAEKEARRAYEELKDFAPDIAAAAFNELGEIRLRMGDLPAAEEAFCQAHEMGFDPQPGHARLRLAEGKVDAAASMIKRALADQSWNRLARARLLPAQVEIAVAARDSNEEAQQAADELEAIAEEYDSPAIHASADCARGALSLERGDAAAAQVALRRGWRLWQELNVPYESATARVWLARAYRAGGDEDAAALELRAAKSAFQRLGAALDADRVEELLSAGAAGGQPVVVRRAAKTFMFTDICKSTNLVEAMGDEAWEHLLHWHDQTLRTIFTEHGGEEIKHAGDGFFVAFPKAAEAIGCAVAIQRRLADHRRSQGFAPDVRIGLHSTEATARGRDYGGKGVHVAARIGAAAEAGEILASHETMAEPLSFSASEPRPVRLKGISEPVQVVSIEWRP